MGAATRLSAGHWQPTPVAEGQETPVFGECHLRDALKMANRAMSGTPTPDWLLKLQQQLKDLVAAKEAENAAKAAEAKKKQAEAEAAAAVAPGEKKEGEEAAEATGGATDTAASEAPGKVALEALKARAWKVADIVRVTVGGKSARKYHGHEGQVERTISRGLVLRMLSGPEASMTYVCLPKKRTACAGTGRDGSRSAWISTSGSKCA